MAGNSQYSTTARNGGANAVTAFCNGGYLQIYSGSQPANADTAVTSQVLLAELRYNATAFGAAVGGVATANALTSDSSADATGTATWCRSLEGDHTTVVFDGSAGTANANLILSAVSIVAGATVSVSSMTYTFPAAGT